MNFKVLRLFLCSFTFRLAFSCWNQIEKFSSLLQASNAKKKKHSKVEGDKTFLCWKAPSSYSKENLQINEEYLENISCYRILRQIYGCWAAWMKSPNFSVRLDFKRKHWEKIRGKLIFLSIYYTIYCSQYSMKHSLQQIPTFMGKWLTSSSI